MTLDDAAKLTRQAARMLAWHGTLDFWALRRAVPRAIPDRFLVEQAGLAGWPVEDTAPLHLRPRA